MTKEKLKMYNDIITSMMFLFIFLMKRISYSPNFAFPAVDFISIFFSDSNTAIAFFNKIKMKLIF